MSEETVKLDVNVGGSASQDMQKLAESLDRAAKAEEAYAKAVKQAADYKAAQQKFEKDVDKEIAGRNPKEEQRKKSRQEEIRDEARNKLNAQRKQKDVQKEMDRQSGAGMAKGLKGGAGALGSLAGGGVSGAAGALGALGPWGMAAGAALMALEAGVKKTTEAINIMNSGVHTAAQKNMMLAEAIVPGLKELKELGEAIDGTTEALARHKREIADGTKMIQAQSAARGEVRQFESSKMDFNRAIVAAAGSRAKIGETKFDRSTAIGQRKYDDFQQVQEKKDTERQAQLQARASDRNMDKQNKEWKDTQTARNKAVIDFDNAMAKVRGLKQRENETGFRDKKGMSEALKDAKLAEENMKARNAEYNAQRDRYAESAVKWAEAESAAKKAGLEVQKAELQVMQQKEQRMAQFAQKLGGMNQGDFEMSKAALEAVKEGGIEDIPAEMADMAAKLAPDYIAKQREALGEKRAKELGVQFGNIDDPTIRDFKDGSLKTIRDKVDKQQMEVRVAIDLDAEKTAGVILEKLGPILGELKRAVDVRVDRLKDQIELDRTLQHVNDG